MHEYQVLTGRRGNDFKIAIKNTKGKDNECKEFPADTIVPHSHSRISFINIPRWNRSICQKRSKRCVAIPVTYATTIKRNVPAALRHSENHSGPNLSLRSAARSMSAVHMKGNYRTAGNALT